MMHFQIDGELLKLKLLYFFEYSICSVVLMYLPTFMYYRGVTITEMAIINFFSNFLTFFLRPLFGYIADKYQNYRQIIIILSIICAFAFTLNLASPKHVEIIENYSLKSIVNTSELSGKDEIVLCYMVQREEICWPSMMVDCSFNKSSDFDLVFNQTNNSCSTYNYIYKNSSVVSEKSYSSALNCGNLTENCGSNNIRKSIFFGNFQNIAITWSSTFWILGILKIIGFSFHSPITNLTDSLVFIVLGKTRSKEFGFTRMFGTFGILVFAVVTGAIIYGMDKITKAYKWNWLIQIQEFSQFAVCFLLNIFMFIAIIIIIPTIKTNKIKKEETVELRKSCVSKVIDVMSLKLIFKDAEIFFLFLFSIFGGLVIVIHTEYYFVIFYEMFPNSPKYFPGLLKAITKISEAFFFGISAKILKWFRYEIWISVTFFMWSVRWIGYSICTEYWHFIFLDILHGPTFGLQFSALISFIGSKADKSNQGRYQGLFSSLYFNIGGCIGGLIGGIIMGNLGIGGLFKFMAFISLLFAVLYCPLQFWFVKRLFKRTQTFNSEELARINSDDKIIDIS